MPKANSSTHVNVGETVWVCAGHTKHEDLATVVELGVPMHDDSDGEGIGGEEKKQNETEKGEELGILVRFDNRIEQVVPWHKVRSLVNHDNDEDNSAGGRGRSRSIRRSTRVSSRISSSQDINNDNKEGKLKKPNKDARSLVMDLEQIDTNDSPVQAKKEGTESDSDDDGDVLLSEFKTSRQQMHSTADKSKMAPPRKGKRKVADVSNEPRKLDPGEEFPIAEEPVTKKKKTKEIEMDRLSSPYFDGKSEKKHTAVTKKKPRRLNMMTEETVKKSTKSKATKTQQNASNENGKMKKKNQKKGTTDNKSEDSIVERKQKSKSKKAGKSDGNGGLDQGSTFCVEYATTARATCKRCDVRIKKNELRVGHRPLFRGKPGYKIFKHLKCIVFTEDVHSVEDIAGYDDLEDEDYEAVAKRIVESREEIQKEKEELDPDELVQKGFDGELRSAPKGLAAKLLPFQVEGVSWMYNQERNVKEIRGGILADEMGMGKTLQTIHTFLDNRPKLQHAVPGGKYPPCDINERKEIDNEERLWEESLGAWKNEMTMNDVHESIIPKGRKKGEIRGGARAGTLVVCPVIALSQWKSEIEKFSDPGALSVCTYHGPDRSKNTPRELLVKYDVVLTTYQVLEADFRKMISPNRVRCPNCGARFKIDKLPIHLKYFCGEGAQRTEAQARTIRNSERSNSARQGGRGNNGDNSSGKKKFVTKKKSSNLEKKKTFKFQSSVDYASESDLSLQDSAQEPKKRSSRNAAVKAKSRLRQSSSKITHKDGESDEDYATSSNAESSDSDFDNGNNVEVSSDDQSSDDEEQASLQRARAKQVKALKHAKSMKKSNFKKKGEKAFPSKSKVGKGKGKQKSVAKGKKKGDKDSDSDDSEDSSDESGGGGLGFDDIDMNALIKEAMAGAQMSILHSVCWWRVVLDEAHMIKSRSSQTSHAAFALTGIHRWCLSGTPLQNRVGEFYSLIRFLRLDPMAHYMCRAKGCGCKQIHYRMMNGKCKDCGHGSIQHYSHFNKHVLNPIQRDGYSHDGRRAMFILKNEVLDKCLLRRTKETRAEDMNLPPRIVNIKTVRLHPIEEDFYNALYTQTTSSFNDYVAGGTLLNNYAHIFDLLMRMRQSVAHPYLVVHSKKARNQDGSAQTITNGRIDCALCHEAPTERVISSCCQTQFCKQCVVEYMETAIGNAEGIPCPHCRDPFSINLNEVHEDPLVEDGQNGASFSTIGLPSLKDLPHVSSGSILRRIDLTKFATSTKIEALTQELVEMRKKNPGSKAIVFSQFINMIDLIRWRLHSDPFLSDLGLGVVALHGGMDVKSRDATLKQFRENPRVRVLLMSLKAGGVALNLTVANHIYLMDPWWNPAAELQAIDRTHRLGQYRPIRAVRFIAENTVEERILQLQEKKRLVFDGTVGRDAGSLKMLTVDDMKSLFA